MNITIKKLKFLLNRVSYYNAAEGNYIAETEERETNLRHIKLFMHELIENGMTPNEWLSYKLSGLWSLSEVLLESDLQFATKVKEARNAILDKSRYN